MLVSHRYRFVYLKTTKTAGTSTELYFQPACMAPSAEPPDWNAPRLRAALVSEFGIVGVRARHTEGHALYNHMPAQAVVDAIGDDAWQQYFRFANVRNPWDKVVSRFFMVADWREPDGSVPSRSAITGMVERFAEEYRRPDVETFLEPGSPRISDVVRYEQLEQDIRRIAHRLGYDGGNAVPRTKALTRPDEFRDHRLVCSDAARRRVSELFYDWIDAFEYRF